MILFGAGCAIVVKNPPGQGIAAGEGVIPVGTGCAGPVAEGDVGGKAEGRRGQVTLPGANRGDFERTELARPEGLEPPTARSEV